jgi:hypothetical protein
MILALIGVAYKCGDPWISANMAPLRRSNAFTVYRCTNMPRLFGLDSY